MNKRLFSLLALLGVIPACLFAGPVPSQLAYLKSSNSEANDQFGQSVAISGNTMVVGAPNEDSAAIGVNGNQGDNNASNSGAAYVFVRIGSQWVQQAYLKASNANASDYFGMAVAIHGDTIVVGAPEEASTSSDPNDNTAAFAGAAYVFVRTGTTWTQQAYLKAEHPDPDDYFGISVAISGNSIVVGAYGEASASDGINGDQTDNSQSSAGAAYVFSRSGSVWTQQAYLKASNSDGSDYFGVSVAIEGDTAVVGANFEASNATGVNGNQGDDSLSLAGAAYVFQRSGTTWVQQAYLKASNTGANDQFGLSLGIAKDTIVVGASGEASTAVGVNGDQAGNGALSAGAAYVFSRTGNQWSQHAYLKASNTQAGDIFGASVGISGDTIIVGASEEDSATRGINGNGSDNTANGVGALYVFNRTGTNWNLHYYVKALSRTSYFGGDCSVEGDLIAVGSQYESSNATGINGDGENVNAGLSGAAYVFSGLGPALRSVARTGTAVAGVQDVAFTIPGAAAVSETGSSIFTSSLNGTGAPRGKESGVFANDALTELLMQKGDGLAGFGYGLGAGSSAAALINPSANRATFGGLFQVIAAGAGINGNNNRALVRDTGAVLKMLARTGQPIASGWGTARPKAFPEMVQSYDSDLIALTTQLLVSAPDGVNANNDSGLIVLDHNGTVSAVTPLREDADAMNGKLGQLTGRVATTTGNTLYFNGILKPTGGGTPLSAVFGTDLTGGVVSQIKQTDPATGATPGTPTYSSFPAIAQRGSDPAFRAMLVGPPRTQNEGIWVSSSLYLQKGTPFTPKGVDPTGVDAVSLLDFSGLQVTRILRFWPVGVDQMIVHAVLGGTGVTSSNNTAVLLRQSDGEWLILLRTGQVAPGVGSNLVKVGAIQSVEVEPIEGSYAIVASLTGVPATRNQALWAGRATAGSPGTPALRQLSLPTLRLRKGDAYATERTVRDVIRSIALKPTAEPTGAGARGLGQAINGDGDILVTLTGDRRVQELILIED